MLTLVLSVLFYALRDHSWRDFVGLLLLFAVGLDALLLAGLVLSLAA